MMMMMCLKPALT